MNGNPTDVVVICHFALASMQPRADFDAKGLDFLGNSTGTTNTTGWSVERGKNAVASRFDLMTAKACEIAAYAASNTLRQEPMAVNFAV